MAQQNNADWGAATPLPTLIRITAYTERGTFYRRGSGCWTAEARREERETILTLFGNELYRAGVQRVNFRCDEFVELPVFGWTALD